MKQPHGLEVKLFDAASSLTKPINEYKNPHGGNDARLGGLLRSQVIAAQPGIHFTLQLVVDADFVKFSAQGVRVVIVARDRSNRGISSSNTVTYWWISMRDKTAEKTYHISKFMNGGKGFVVPQPVDPKKGNPDWHRHPTEYQADSGCIAVYVERGKLLNMKAPPIDTPPMAIQNADFRALANDNGSPYIFEFRNRGLSETLGLQVSPPSTFEYDSDNYVVSDREVKRYIAEAEDAMDIDEEEAVLEDVFSCTDSSSGSNDGSDSDDEGEESEADEDEDEDPDEEEEEEYEDEESERDDGATKEGSTKNNGRSGIQSASRRYLSQPKNTASTKRSRKMPKASVTNNVRKKSSEQDRSLNRGSRKRDGHSSASQWKAKQARYTACAVDSSDSDVDDEEPLSAQDIEMYRNKQEKLELNRSSHNHIPQAINQHILKDSVRRPKSARSRCSDSDHESQDVDDEMKLIELEISRNRLEIQNNLLMKQHIELRRRKRMDTNRIRSVKDRESRRL